MNSLEDDDEDDDEELVAGIRNKKKKSDNEPIDELEVAKRFIGTGGGEN